jgi:PST family polysaccharide transporter
MSAITSFFSDNKAGSGLRTQSVRGGVASIASRGINVLVQVASTFILARLISPDDLGLVAMVSAVTGFAPVLIDLGTRDAAVQKASITEEEVSGLFWLTVGIGTGLAALLCLCSGLIVSFYHNEARLQGIAVCSSLTFILGALSCQHFALLRRAMMFQKIAAIEVGSNAVGSIVAIYMAANEWGYWALVAKPIVVSAFTAVAVFVCCPWLPKLPRLTEGVKEMLKFGVNITGFTMADYVGRAMDRIALGRKRTTAEVGYYQQAFFVYDNAINLMSVSLHSVAVASLSKLRDNLEKLRQSWASALSAVAFFAMPVFAILAVTGRDAVVLIMGEKWVHAGVLVEVMAIRGIPHVVERTLGWLHVAGGRADRWMRWGIISSLAHVAALFCGLPFGAMGVAVAYAAVMYLLFVPALAYAGAPVGITWRAVLRTVGPQLIGAWICAGAGFGLEFLFMENVARLPRVVYVTMSCLLIYYVVVVCLFRVTKPVRLARHVLLDMLPARLGLPQAIAKKD